MPLAYEAIRKHELQAERVDYMTLTNLDTITPLRSESNLSLPSARYIDSASFHASRLGLCGVNMQILDASRL